MAVSRIFLSHSSKDKREAIALKSWLAEQNPPLANEIFLDVDPESGLRAGTRWKDALRRANARCEAVVCLLSANWEASHECKVEYRTAENLNKQIFVARLDTTTGDDNMTSEWQRCDLFGDGPKTSIDVGSGPPVEFSTGGLYRLRDGIAGAGIGADSFVWPPPSNPRRAPYRGWEPLESIDAAVFFGRDTQILRALDAIRGMRRSGVDSLFVILGPSGTGKSSFLRAGILPRLRREDRRFVVMDIVRPERNALTGDSGLAASICATRAAYGLHQPSLGQVKAMCEARDVAAVSALLAGLRATTATRLLDREDAGADAPAPPTLVLPLDQAEELFSVDAGTAAGSFLGLLVGVIEAVNATEIGLVVAATIRTDRFEIMQTHPRLAGVGSVLFDELKPMPPTQFKEVILGPAARSTDSGRPLRIAPDLVDQLLLDAGEGADTLPMLALTMARLYTDYGATGELALSHYRMLGGMRRVVQTEIDEVLSSDPTQHAAQLTALRSAFVPWLATINAENDQPMRRVARWADLPEASKPLIDALVSKRLMVKDTRNGQAVVEVALESLLRQWDELAGWLREERKDLKDADDLERSAAAWGVHRHNPAWLLEGTRLTDATALVNKPGFSQRLGRVHGYLNASHERENQRRSTEEQRRQAELRTAQERAEHAQTLADSAREQQATAEAYTATLRQRSRVMRAVLAGTAVIAVLALVASVFAFVSRGQAQDRFRQATGVRLNSEAQAMLAGSRPGGDTRAIQELLAARSLTAQPDDDVLYSAVADRATTSKIIPVGYVDDPESDFVVAWNPEGTLLATSTGKGEPQLVDAESGQLDGGPLTGLSGSVWPMAFSHDGAVVAAANSDGAIALWDTESREQRGDLLEGGGGQIGSLAFGVDGETLAAAGDDGVQLWNPETGEAKGGPYTGQGAADYVEFSADGRLFASASYDFNNVQLWDANTGSPLGDPIAGPEDADKLIVALSPNGRYLAIGVLVGDVQVWDTQTREKVGEPVSGGTGSISLAFSPDGRVLAIGGADKTITLWDAQVNDRIGEPLKGHEEYVVSVAFSSDGESLASRSPDGTVRIWDVSGILVGHAATVGSVAYSPDGTRLASAGVDGIRIWDVATGQSVGAPIAVDTRIAGVAFTTDGQRIVSGDTEGTIRMWNAETGQAVGNPITATSRDMVSFAMSPDGALFASGDETGTVEVWDAESGRSLRSLDAGDGVVTSLAFSQDAGFLVSTSEAGTVVWDPLTGDEIRRLNVDRGRDSVRVAVSADGTRIAAAGVDSAVRIYDVESGDPVGEPLRGHTDVVLGIGISPDGSRIVSGGSDGTVRVWDAQTGRPIGGPISGHLGPVLSVAVSPDGRQIASGSDDFTVRLLPATASPQDLCAKLTSNMSEKQWDEWVSPEIDYVGTCPDLPVAPD